MVFGYDPKVSWLMLLSYMYTGQFHSIVEENWEYVASGLVEWLMQSTLKKKLSSDQEGTWSTFVLYTAFYNYFCLTIIANVIMCKPLTFSFLQHYCRRAGTIEKPRKITAEDSMICSCNTGRNYSSSCSVCRTSSTRIAHCTTEHTPTTFILILHNLLTTGTQVMFIPTKRHLKKLKLACRLIL